MGYHQAAAHAAMMMHGREICLKTRNTCEGVLQDNGFVVSLGPVDSQKNARKAES
jgi:hypothetical protein